VLRIECAPPKSRGTEAMVLTRYVYDDHGVYAVYLASLGSSHPYDIDVVISVGSWADDSTPRDRDAFALRLWREGFAVIDGAESPWTDAEVLGRLLDRAEALDHPRIDDVFDLAHRMYAHDDEIHAFFTRGN
jgi:hypothetical protein